MFPLRQVHSLEMFQLGLRTMFEGLIFLENEREGQDGPEAWWQKAIETIAAGIRRGCFMILPGSCEDGRLGGMICARVGTRRTAKEEGTRTSTMSFMRMKIPVLIFISLWGWGALRPDAVAETAAGCHCFKERAFNPADKFGADEYILATSFNSLLSRSFDLPKREIVMLKMQGGVGQNDLLIALQAAKVSGTELKHLLSFRERKFSWQKILSELLPSESFKNDPALQGLRSGLSETEAGPKIAEHLLIEFFYVPERVILELRALGLNEKEMALLLILDQTGKLTPREGARQHAQEGKSWSEIAHQLGVEPADAGKLMIEYQANKLQE